MNTLALCPIVDAGDGRSASARVSGWLCFCVTGGDFHSTSRPLTNCSRLPHHQLVTFNWTAMPPAAAPAPPPVARTTFTFVAGDTLTGRPPSFDIAEDSPLITSLPFLPWHEVQLLLA